MRKKEKKRKENQIPKLFYKIYLLFTYLITFFWDKTIRFPSCLFIYIYKYGFMQV